MSRPALELMTPRILVVDDERQIHASVRLRLAKDYSLTCCFDAQEALAKIAEESFDLCLADIHMPRMDGLSFIETARERDPELGFVVFSAFDSDENLRRAIPLQVYEFIPKPLPDRDGFEHRMPEWVERTRRRRHERSLSARADVLEQHLDSARLEREVELVASESARDALQQTANLLTTIHAHLVMATSALAARARSDSGLSQLLRNLDEARRTADAAVAVAGEFFDSAYGSRDSSPALPSAGLRHAIGIASRIARAEETNKRVDFAAEEDRQSLRNLSGIDLLLLAVPLLGLALAAAEPDSTVRVQSDPLDRLEAFAKDARLKNFLWLNRKNARLSLPGRRISVSVGRGHFSRHEVESWLRGEALPRVNTPARGLIAGLQKSGGVLAVAVCPPEAQFRLELALPV
ncbi:MAG TPA: response regulator [Opitutaceae bacterium]|nr:response regulator [Opitutaceae bacterium]